MDHVSIAFSSWIWHFLKSHKLVNHFYFKSILYPDIGHCHLICSFRSLVLVRKHQSAAGTSLEGIVVADCLKLVWKCSSVFDFQRFAFHSARSLSVFVLKLYLCTLSHVLTTMLTETHKCPTVRIFSGSTAEPQTATCSLQIFRKQLETKYLTALRWIVF